MSALASALPRADYLAAAAAAVGRGDLAALPVLADAWDTPAADRCPDCRGTGYDLDERGRLAVCFCVVLDGRTGGQHPGFDMRRMPRPTRPDGTPGHIWCETLTGVYVPCPDCPADLSATDPCVCPPWVPDCVACHDTGWAPRRPLSGDVSALVSGGVA